MANNDSYTATENTPLAVAAPGVLANDTDSSNSPLTAVLVAGPAHGTLALNADGSFTYTPATNFLGTDSFTYEVGDGMAFSGTATVTLTVAPPAQATLIRSDTTTEGNWMGTYGAQGYDVIDGASNLPSYATVTPSGANDYVWDASTTDPRPAGPRHVGPDRRHLVDDHQLHRRREPHRRPDPRPRVVLPRLGPAGPDRAGADQQREHRARC